MTLLGIAENIVADILFLIIVILLGWLLFALTHRARLLSFFGIKESRRIVVYFSNLRITSGGAIGVDNQRRSYQGSAAAIGELFAAIRFRDLFNYLLPSLSENPGVLSRLLISDVQIQMIHSPLNEGELERSCSFVALGSPAYNLASLLAQKAFHSQAQYRLGQVNVSPDAPPTPYTVLPVTDSTNPVITGSTMGVSFHGPADPSQSESSKPQISESSAAILIEGIPDITGNTHGFVERIVDHNQGRCIFYVAGLSELATAGAAHYLATQWTYLHGKYGDKTPFLIMLRFAFTDFRQWSIAFEK